MSILKTDELMGRLGVTAGIVQDVAVDTLDTVNAGLLTAAENKETVIAGVITAYAVNDMINNGAGIANTLVAVVAGGKALKGMKKVRKDFENNRTKVREQAKELADLLGEEDEE